MSASDSYFVRVDEHRYRPTEHVGGAWTPTALHISPFNGLVVHAVERSLAAPDDVDLAITRLSFDILGVLSEGEDFDVDVEVIRPGRTVELVEATVSAEGRAAVRARLWRLARFDSGRVAGGQPHPLPPPQGLDPWPLTDVWPGGYVASVDVRPVQPPAPGRALAWMTSKVQLIADEPVSDLAHYIALVDTANGIAVRRPPTEWMFANVDLTIHLFRQPSGRRVGFDTTVIFGSDGRGVTSSVLHDHRGAVGQAAQMLTVRPLG